jgi:class 3 adenylate cyclase
MSHQEQTGALALRPPIVAYALGSRLRAEGERLLRGIEQILTGAGPRRSPERTLTTVLFTDIVGSTRCAAKLGDRRWRRLLHAHDMSVRSHVATYGGEVLKSMGDGYLVSFSRPACAIHYGRAVGHDARELGLRLRAGVHIGECERVGADLAGIALHIGARVMAEAAAGEVLATGVVRDLVVGSDIEFSDRGVHELRGVPGEWSLHAVEL